MRAVSLKLTAFRVAVSGLALGAAVPLVLLPMPSASAEPSFEAVAGANAVDTTASDAQDIPLVGYVEAGGAMGQARLDSNGHSVGFAAFPNPGAAAAGAGALAGAPAFPLYISAENGQAPQDVSHPGLHLHAEGKDASATGFAVVGQDGAASSSSNASVMDRADGSVEAKATSAADGLVVAGTVRIGGVDAASSATRDAKGRLKTSSHLAISSIQAGGQSFGFSDGTFTAGPAASPVPASTVLSQLAAAGVTARYQQPMKHADGIIGGNLTVAFDVPATPQTAAVHVVYVLGETDAAIAYHPFGGSSSGGSTAGGSTSSGDSGTLAAPPAMQSDTGAPDRAGAVGALVAPAPVAPSVAAQPSASTAPVALVRSPRRIDMAWLYLSVVIAAIAVLGATQAVRLLGVRVLWTS
jgi:hypothetical protein